MAKAKKTAASAKPAGTKPIADVAHPGTTAPSDTSRPIINQRPIMKDPMVVEEDKTEDKKPLPKKTAETKIAPPEEPEKPAEEETEPEAEPDEAEPAVDDKTDDAAAEDEKTDSDTEKKAPKSGPDDESKAEAAEDAKLQQLIDSKKYFLPINAVEHRRSKRVVIVGIVLALILVVAWVDIALDASLIHIDGVKPVTHFFSN